MVRLSDTDATYEQYALSPHPVSPAPLVSVGDSGSFEVMIYGGENLFDGVVYRENGMYEEFTGNWNARTDLDTYRISVLPNTKYVKLGDWNGIQVFFDKNMNYLAGSGSNTPPGSVVTAPNNSAYYCCTISKNVDKSNIEFKQAQTLTLTDTLRSNKSDVTDEIDFTRGMKIERMHSVIINSMSGVTITTIRGATRFDMYGTPKAKWSTVGMCNSLTVDSTPIGENYKDNCISSYAADGGVYFRCDALANATDKNAWLAEHPIYFIYPLATPIETPLTDAEMYAYRQLHTNNPNTTIIAEGSPEMCVEYFRNTEDSEALIKHSDQMPAIRKVYTPYGIYKPYYSAGDSIDIETEVTGIIASSKQDIYFGIPLPKPIIGNPTITVSSINGLMVRQAGRYCFTTANTTYVKPTSYYQPTHNVNLYMGARMPNTTNVTTGNDPCWINVSVRVTFS
jgi:hypothetical protein